MEVRVVQSLFCVILSLMLDDMVYLYNLNNTYFDLFKAEVCFNCVIITMYTFIL